MAAHPSQPQVVMMMQQQQQQQHFGYSGVASGAEAHGPQGSDGRGVATLLVRHLPEAIPHDTLTRLFSHYGASAVRPCAGGRMRNCAFVDFRDEASASQAQSQLNRLRFLGKVLSVERAAKASLDNKNGSEGHLVKESTPAPATLSREAPLTGHIAKEKVFGLESNAEPIAPRLGVDYPFPPHLEYAYPPPDGNILTNIVNALIAVPRFYTQVLHLMNKMNIPAPFRMALPTPPLPPSEPAPPPPPPPQTSVKHHLEDLSSDESELESSDEDDVNEKDSAGMPCRKRVKKEPIIGPAVDKGVAHEAVGIKHATLVPKEIPLIKKKNPVLQFKIAPKPIKNEVADSGSSGKEVSSETAEQDSKLIHYATPQEIEKAKLPPEEILSLPMFKNYTAGDPAPVLYIKNLAKDVVVDDFYFIFGSLFGSVEATKTALGVKLMQEGRMRGQAFLTYPSVDLARHALNLVNGYVFKGKPMIIQFGRNPAAGKAS